MTGKICLSRRWFIGLILLFLQPIHSAAAEPAASAQTAAVLSEESPYHVESAIFGLAILLDDESLVGDALRRSSRWIDVSHVRQLRIETAVTSCAQDGLCGVGAMKWTEQEKRASSDALLMALSARGQLGPLARAMRESGAFSRYADLPDRGLVEQAWGDLLAAQNRIIDVYGTGQPPLYPLIDSISFDRASKPWTEALVEATNHIIIDKEVPGGLATHSPRADPGYRLALQLLYLNGRENAGSFVDLDVKENAPVRAAIASMNWSAYPYSLILLLGDGPDRPGQTIGTLGKLRIEHAVRLYRNGEAPFIVVSGGNVHPALTPLNEAVEMKRELMTRYGIAESAIVMEPHARHTTTNFRNTARLIIRYGVPLDKPAIATSSEKHSQYAGGPNFDKKAMDEISFVPRRIGKRLSPFDFEFYANPESLHRDARDPLDP